LNRLATVAGLEAIRETSITELGARLESPFQFGSAEEWIAKIRSVGLSAHVLVNYEESMENLLIKQRGLSVVRNHPEIGDVRSVGSPAKLSRTPLISLFSAPPLGWHAREILGEIGYGDRLEECVNAGVVGAPTGN
jgi:crotonobetainyl-CoA:carnitine CoA-transferase CaiB-like acyl-CoA transferase